MAYIRDRGFVLKHEALREHDAWISIYGERHGKLVGIARGHRRLTGKQIGHMEPLVLAEVMIAEGKQVDKIAVSRVVEPYHGIRKDLSKVVILSSCLSLVDMLTRPGVPDQRIFAHIEELFQLFSGLTDSPSKERAQLFYSWFALRLLSLSGNIASFTDCVICRRELTEPIYPIPKMGGGVCARCAKAEGLESHDTLPMTWKLLRLIQGASCEDIASVSAQKALFRQANAVISDMLEFVPADGEPHGFRTISGVLA